MGAMVQFSTNGTTSEGYLAVPSVGSGPGLIVIQEWWGLVDHIKTVADRFSNEGFVALAPDLYDGRTTTSPDEAGKLMMALNIDLAEKQLRNGIDYLLSRPDVTGVHVGTVGFCMGGQLSLYAACANPKVGACVDFYGIHPSVSPDLKRLHAPVLAFFAEQDRSIPSSEILKLKTDLEEAGKQFEITTFQDADHAFFNDDRPEVYNEIYAKQCWSRMLEFCNNCLR